MFGLFGPKIWKYARLVPFTEPYSHPETVEAMVAVYRAVFTEDPWNEGMQCPKCGAVYHRKQKKKFCESEACKSLQVLLIEPWTVSKVIGDIYRETTTEGAKCLLAYRRKRLVGFAWGYPKEISPKLSAELDAPGLHEQLQGTYFYVDEVAVLLPYRGKKIGKHLFAKIIDGENERIFLRTHKDSPMRIIAEKAGCKVIQSISRDRVMMTL